MTGAPVLREVTPDEAAGWLHAGGRPASDRDKVQAMVEAMRAGQWNPDLHADRPVRVRAGALVNGTHRTTALIEYGRPVPMWVIERTPGGHMAKTTRYGQVVTHPKAKQPEPPAVSPWAELTVDELRRELGERGLPVSGNKADLIARLEAADHADG